MHLKDISFLRPQENILYDEVLLDLAEKGVSREVLRFWESPKVFVVLGRTGRIFDDVYLRSAQKDDIPILRRLSGGGTVLQGQGCLNYSLILSKERNPFLRDLHKSYEEILDRIAKAISRLNIKIVFRPICDLIREEEQKKISGNAQHRRKRYFLHHGTILYDFDIGLIEKYLKIPKEMPDYRKGRTHRDFVTNIPVSAVDLKRVIADCFGITQEDKSLSEEEKCTLNEFMERKLPHSIKIEKDLILIE